MMRNVRCVFWWEDCPMVVVIVIVGFGEGFLVPKIVQISSYMISTSSNFIIYAKFRGWW